MAIREINLMGNEDVLYTYNQLYFALNNRTGHKFALSTFARFMDELNIRPLFRTATKESSGLYSEDELDRIVDGLSNGTIGTRKQEKKVQVKMTQEEYDAWMAGRE